MRARFNPAAKEDVGNYSKYVENVDKLQEILNNNDNKNKKKFIEIGMGKGDFIANMANNDPSNIYIGIELCLPVMALAIKKIERFKCDNNVELSNLYLMSFDAIELNKYFKNSQVDKIYLNFSDPWPKKRHTKRRLTYKDFLQVYKQVLKKDCIIEFKTDNRLLFEYSLVSIQNFGMEFLEVYLDLHKTDIPNIMTEYERKFSPNGPIYKLVAKMK